MSKKILITGATDGLGYETAKEFRKLGHEIIVHGRNIEKLKRISSELDAKSYRADLSDLNEVKKMADDILNDYSSIDVLINNAGVFKTSNTKTKEGYDIRFVVNTFAPYLLTKKLLPLLVNGRVINLSSAAQASVDIHAMAGRIDLSDFEAYAQSKLAITMWSRHMAKNLVSNSPVIIAVNPASLLGTKMVKEGFNTTGNDINIGVNILTKLALDPEHAEHSGEYYDNDNRCYSLPQADGTNDEKAKEIVAFIEEVI